MKTRLTLRMDEDLIRRAKKIARDRDLSMSQLVAEFLERLVRETVRVDLRSLPPITRSLFGVAAGADIGEEEHRRQLVEKHSPL